MTGFALRGWRRLARRRFVLPVAVLGGAALLASVLTGGTPSAAPGMAPAHAQIGVRTYVAVGDSITAGMAPGLDSLSNPGPTSWLNGETAARLVLVGGWAQPGSITEQMRAGVVPTPADVLVLLGGTNDITRGIPWSTTEANLRAISATVGARRTLLVAIPPSDALAAARNAFDAHLRDLAVRARWRFVDPWTSVDVGGAWAPGTTVEGIHPTPEVAAAAGRVIAARAWQVAAIRTGS